MRRAEPHEGWAERCLVHPGRQSETSERTPMFELDATVAAAIFFSSFALDLIAARYTGDVVALRAGRAASLSFLWHMLSAVVVIEYAHNAVYIVFVCLGGALGTYFTIWSTRRAGTASERSAPIAADVASAVPESFAPALSRGAMPCRATARASALVNRADWPACPGYGSSRRAHSR
jgi:hypothetical protein